jgi:Bacterial PH domain
MTLFRRPWIEDPDDAGRRTIRDDLNPFRRLLADDKYRAPDEPVVRLRRHHWMAAVMPFSPPVTLFLLWVVYVPFARLEVVLFLKVVHTLVRLSRRVPMKGIATVVWSAIATGAGWFFLGADVVVFLVVLATLGRALFMLVEFYTTRLYLTDRRIFRVWGLITRRAATLPLRSLTDMSFDETLLGKALGYGHFRVESAGQNQALSLLEFVEEPWEFYKTVMALAPPAARMSEDLGYDRRTEQLAEYWWISLGPPAEPPKLP